MITQKRHCEESIKGEQNEAIACEIASEATLQGFPRNDEENDFFKGSVLLSSA